MNHEIPGNFPESQISKRGSGRDRHPHADGSLHSRRRRPERQRDMVRIGAKLLAVALPRVLENVILN